VRDSTIARSYAEALFDLGDRHGQLEEFAVALDVISALLESEPKLRLFLASPKIEPGDKKRVLRSSLHDRVPPLILNFLMVVLDRRRQRLIEEFGVQFHALLDERHGRLHVKVTLAHEPDERMEREIAADLSQALGLTVIPHVRVDPEILGGIIVRYGDRVLDGSVRRQLVSLRRQMLTKAVLV